jgi:CRISPR-associated endonuclease/helicase Cas3
MAAEWFTYRKRGLLAPFGVGTIDQALLAVLHTKHVFVRLFGLAHKVVILDEVHAYDTYMSTLVEQLLKWLAALGSSVVLLSATLPSERRRALLAAFAQGLGLPEPQMEAIAYPRLSWIDAASSGARHVPAAATRTLRLELVQGAIPYDHNAPFELGERLRAALAEGGCAAVICNTVSRAQRVYAALRAYFAGTADDGSPELELFHARYPFRDRQAREQRALMRFGKEGQKVALDDGRMGEVRRPRRAVLVATQVIEQSLDLDFDLMVTDIAPVDLVLQRSGRLWRHDRAWRPAWMSGVPVLWICKPNATNEGVPVFERGFTHVYQSHILLRTWLALSSITNLRLPEDIDKLVQGVYRRETCPAGQPAPVRAYWERTWAKLQADQRDESLEARDRQLADPLDEETKLYSYTQYPQDEDRPDLHPAHQALTRLAEPSVRAIVLDPEAAERLVSRTAGAPGIDVARELLAHSVTLSHRGLVDELLAVPAPDSWKRSALLRDCRLLRLDNTGLAFEVTSCRVQLDSMLGIVIRAGKEEEQED